MNKIFKFCFLVALLSLATASAVQAQTLRSITIGNIEYFTRSDFASERLNYPVLWRDPNNRLLPNDNPDNPNDTGARDMHGSTYGFMIGVNTTWTSGSNTFTKRVTALIPVKWSDTKHMTIPKAYQRTFKYRPAHRVINGTDFTDLTIDQDPVDPTIPSDVMIYTKFETDQKIDVERWAYGLCNDKYNEFIITEWRFTNVGTEEAKDVYFAILTGIGSIAYGTTAASFWGNYYGANYKDYVAGDQSADSLRIYYAFDGDIKTSKEDDIGNPDLTYGYFKKPMYIGHAVLHADKSASDETDDPGQPIKAGHSMRQWCPELSLANHEVAYAYLSGPWDNTIPDLYTYKNQGFYRMLPPDWVEADHDPTFEPEKTSLQSFGPYQIKPGEDVHIVTAYCVGSISFKTAIDAGWAYDPGNVTTILPRRPMPYDYGTFIKKGDLLTKAQKDRLIATGRDSLFKAASLAQRLWKSSNVKYGKGTFNVEFPPPAPDLTANSEIGKIQLSWGDQAERAGNIKCYRIYRNYWRIPTLKDPCDTSFVLIKDNIPPGTRSYEDYDVIAGESYYYYVTAVGLNGVESDPLYNRTGALKTGTDRLKESVTSSRVPDQTGWKNNVVVVPNPYHARGLTRYQGTTKLNFFNLPAYCNIHIYTMKGDKVQSIRHMTGTGEQAWDRQETFDTTAIVSGIYLFVVEELDSSGKATGESTIGKFVVVK
ncbi:MAG: hypothetical protein ONB05_05495 [candidate division KSB1 bacterium]|nr:hypothetical protein [candidate division KSB1 bacterium]